jgi:hypothetical protein
MLQKKGTIEGERSFEGPHTASVTSLGWLGGICEVWGLVNLQK